MTQDLLLRRKWTLRAHGRQVVFVKRAIESSEHVLMKAFIWALYLPQYPQLQIEVPIGDRYKPDVVQLDRFEQHPIFWGEAGEVGQRKIHNLAKRFRKTHFAIGKWDTNLEPHRQLIQKQLATLRRSAPFDLLCFPEDAGTRFIDDGEITITHGDLQWVRIEPAELT